MKKILFAAMLLASTGSAFAGVNRDGRECFSWCGEESSHHSRDRDAGPVASAPEIDPASAMSGLALLAGGLAVLRGRKFANTKA